jgi:mRNA interferase HigB
VNVISKSGLTDLLKGKPKDVEAEAIAWFHIARSADWKSFADVRNTFADADMVDGLLVFNIRRNRYRLIVYPVFSRLKLYVKALLTHQEYDKGGWKTKWP